MRAVTVETRCLHLDTNGKSAGCVTCNSGRSPWLVRYADGSVRSFPNRTAARFHM